MVQTADAFAEVCRCLGDAERVAFDAEFVAEDAYTAQVCLIQVATQERVWLIDPLAGFEVTPFWELVGDQRIEKVVHAGFEDLAISFHQTGQVPQNIFDIQIAAGLVGFDYPMSLLRLVRAVQGVKLPKSQTLTNWRKRPLSAQQIRYAVEDVLHLLPIRSSIHERLQAMNRVEWAREEFARFSSPETYQSDVQELFHRIKGVGSLDRKGLAIARELAIERDKLARRFNRPPRVLLKDHLIIEIARHALTRREELASLRGFSLRADALRRTLAAVQRGLNMPPEQRPKPVEVDDDTKQEQAIRKLLSAVLDDYCRSEGIALQLLATNSDIRALVLSHTRRRSKVEGRRSKVEGVSGTLAGVAPGALQRGWRKQAIGGLMDDLLSGRRAVRVVAEKRGFRLGVE
ncbi:MAG: HRDC domain-containing protein [Phycisphaerae bacterium]